MSKWRIVVFAITLSVLTLLSACTSLPYTITKQSSIDKAIVAARAETRSQLEALSKQQTDALRQMVDIHVAREQSASDALFKGLAVGTMLKTPTRPEMVMGQSIQQTAAQLPPATAVAQAKAFQDLKTELDEARVSTETLRAQYETELGKARAEGAAKEVAVKDLTTKLAQVDQERVTVLTKAKYTEAALSDKRKEVDSQALADKQRQLNDAKHAEKVKMWLMGILLTAAAACGIGAAFLPIPALKTKLIIGAALCGGAAIAIPFIEPWMVMVTIGVCLLLVAGWVIADYKREHGDATDTFRAINEFKAKASETFAKELAPILGSWHTDPATTQRIDTRLKQVGDT